jgi:purine nucleosidase
LSGKELVSKKVAKWFCMGGHFPSGPREANFYRPDPQSTVYCVREFPKPVLFAGWEVGVKIQTGGEYLKNKLNLKSPVYRAYQLYNNFQGRASWDQVAVFMLMEEAGRYFTTVRDGYCQVYEDGSNKWLTDHDRNHRYITFKPGIDVNQVARLMDDLAGQ